MATWGNDHTEKRNAERHRAAAKDGGRVRASESIRKREPKVNERRDRPGEKDGKTGK